MCINRKLDFLPYGTAQCTQSGSDKEKGFLSILIHQKLGGGKVKTPLYYSLAPGVTSHTVTTSFSSFFITFTSQGYISSISIIFLPLPPVLAQVSHSTTPTVLHAADHPNGLGADLQQQLGYQFPIGGGDDCLESGRREMVGRRTVFSAWS